MQNKYELFKKYGKKLVDQLVHANIFYKEIDEEILFIIMYDPAELSVEYIEYCLPKSWKDAHVNNNIQIKFVNHPIDTMVKYLNDFENSLDKNVNVYYTNNKKIPMYNIKYFEPKTLRDVESNIPEAWKELSAYNLVKIVCKKYD